MSNFKVYFNSKEIALKVFKFSGGEIQVQLQVPQFMSTNTCTIEAHVRSADDLITLALLNDAILREANPRTRNLIMPYLPYARQDRVCARGEALAVKVCTDLLNSLKFDTVEIWDSHSDVGVALLDNCWNRSQVDIIGRSGLCNFLSNPQYVLVSPDAGANKKTFEVAKAFHCETVVRADKVRNVQTGEITGTEVYGDVQGKTCVIVDDIADGGMTFMKLAEKLKEMGAAEVILYVTHGIFSKGVDRLLQYGVDSIYTPCYWPEGDHKDVNIIKV